MLNRSCGKISHPCRLRSSALFSECALRPTQSWGSSALHLLLHRSAFAIHSVLQLASLGREEFPVFRDYGYPLSQPRNTTASLMPLGVKLSTEEYNAAAYLRVASLAVAGFDFLQTLPVVWRFYRDQMNLGRVTLSALLFFLIQFISICCLVVSSTGFFYSAFTVESCKKFYLIPPSFKVLQAMVSQAILGVRAHNLSRRSKSVGWGLGLFYVIACTLQWVSTLYGRQHALDPTYRNCRGVTVSFNNIAAWIYYVIAIAYDLSATAVSVYYLLQLKFHAKSSLMYRLTNMMLYDGLGYFFLLTCVNIANLFAYRSLNIQTAACSVGYAITWIMCQRLLLHLHNASMERRMESINAAVTISQNIESSKAASRVLRSQFEQKSGHSSELTIPDFDLDSSVGSPEIASHVGVQVRIERTVRFERRPRTFELENYTQSARSIPVTRRDTDIC